MKLFLALTLLAAVACSKESTDVAADVSGTYYIRDTTRNSINNYPVGPYTYEIRDTNYNLTVTYADRENNIVQIGASTYKLDENGAYKYFFSALGGYTRINLTLSNNQLYYLYNGTAGGNTYYTCLTGTKVK